MNTNTDSKKHGFHRVVVTGVGAITANGLTIDQTWDACLKSQSGISLITKFNTENFDVKFAGEVKSFNADDFVPKKEQKKMDTFIHYAIACTKMALDQSGLVITEELSPRVGTIIGAGMGGLPAIEEQHSKLIERGPSRISPFFIPMVISNMAAGQVSMMFNLKGPNYCLTSACASGAHSIGEAANYIKLGYCDVMVAGGTEATVSPMAIGGFASMKALSTRNESPQEASRPYDKDRDGFVLAEGAAILILESYEHAKARGAKILCELSGYGASSDAYHMTTPAPGGTGAAQAMQMALRTAQLNPDQIQYVNTHGTSTPAGDEVETEAIKSVFKDHAKKLWVSSTKSMLGHTLGAAGAIESALCVKTLETQKVAPTINLHNPSEGCDLDYVPHIARDGKIDHVVNNSFGFGGTNAVLIFSKI